ncbi:hypothetical protein GQ600_4239 [Phytophthora cactorum]|nr:hypothetical protein GQ600_4239 [Phytophthora cactorum]
MGKPTNVTDKTRGKQDFESHGGFPDDMFEDMSASPFSLWAFVPMVKLPSFDGLTNLKSLTLAVFLLLRSYQPSIISIILNGLCWLASQQSTVFVALDRGAWCCNGFLGACDLRNDNCGVHPFWGAQQYRAWIRTVQRIWQRQQHWLQWRHLKLSLVDLSFGLEPMRSPTPEKMAPCNGTMYRQCGNTQSMCYNARFMGIACRNPLSR